MENSRSIPRTGSSSSKKYRSLKSLGKKNMLCSFLFYSKRFPLDRIELPLQQELVEVIIIPLANRKQRLGSTFAFRKKRLLERLRLNFWTPRILKISCTSKEDPPDPQIRIGNLLKGHIIVGFALLLEKLVMAREKCEKKLWWWKLE